MRYGLIGEKLTHSFSKIIHEKLCSYTYDLIPLAKEEVADFMTRREFSAINVTIPYKETVLPYLTYIDPAAKMIGAVNTIVNKGGLLYGYNTDFAGIEYLLDKHGIVLRDQKVLILGSGGTCKTSRAVAMHRGAREILIVSRHPGAGQISYEQALSAHTDAQVIFNTTPCGMYPNVEAQAVDLTAFPHLSAVVDVIYNPLKTNLLQQAEKLGIPCCNGLEMLVAQAKYAAERFLEISIPDAQIGQIHSELLLQMRSIALIGMPSCGKTTIGKQVAAQTGKRFVDLDEEIVRVSGRSIPDIFSQHGESYFRKLESDVLAEVSGSGGLVIATGGGIVKDERNISLLRHNCRIYFLDRPLAQLISSDPSRPLSSSKAAVDHLYAERLPLYRQYSDAQIANNGAQADAVRAIKEDFYEASRSERAEFEHAGHS